MNYCVRTTQTHALTVTHPNCLTDLNTLIFKEGCLGATPLFTKNEVVINLDSAEAIVAQIEGRKEKKMSMDLAFGINNVESTKAQIQMVELKFNVRDFYAVRKVDLEEKVAGSCKILGDSPPIVNLYIFIFSSNNLHEGVSRLCRMIPKIQSNYVAMDINSLREKYFS